jgi:hypothetical protein
VQQGGTPALYGQTRPLLGINKSIDGSGSMIPDFQSQMILFQIVDASWCMGGRWQRKEWLIIPGDMRYG